MPKANRMKVPAEVPPWGFKLGRVLERRDATLRIYFSFSLPYTEEPDGSVVFTDSSKQEVRTLQVFSLIVAAIILIPTLQLIGTLIAIGGNPWLLGFIGAIPIGFFAALPVFISRRFSASRSFQFHRGGRVEIRETLRGVERIQVSHRARLTIHRTSMQIGLWEGWGLYLNADRRCYLLVVRRRRTRVEQHLHDLPQVVQQYFRGEGGYRVLGGAW